MKEGYIRVGILPRIPFSDPDTEAAYWDFLAELQEEDRNMSRPKDQDRAEPATPVGTRTSSLGWTGEGQFTVGELRSWLDRIPNNATLEILLDPMNKHELEIRTTIQATWEAP